MIRNILTIEANYFSPSRLGLCMNKEGEHRKMFLKCWTEMGDNHLFSSCFSRRHPCVPAAAGGVAIVFLLNPSEEKRCVPINLFQANS